jgi:hypothetical protein
VSDTLKAIKYENLDHALRALSEVMESPPAIFDDAGEEPQGLLTVVPGDRLPEETFYDRRTWRPIARGDLLSVV